MRRVWTPHDLTHISCHMRCTGNRDNLICCITPSQAHAVKSNKSLNHHCHLQSAWPSPSSCAGCLPQRSHTALALPLYGHSEQQAELQSSHPKGEGAKLTVTKVVRIKGKVPNISQQVKMIDYYCQAVSVSKRREATDSVPFEILLCIYIYIYIKCICNSHCIYNIYMSAPCASRCYSCTSLAGPCAGVKQQ